MLHKRTAVYAIVLITTVWVCIWFACKTKNAPVVPLSPSTPATTGRPAPHDSTAHRQEKRPIGTLIRALENFEETKRLNVGAKTSVSFPRPDGRPPHGDFVPAERRTLLKSPELEIRETVAHGGLAVRVVEELVHPGTADERVVAREEMAPDQVVLGFEDSAKAQATLTKLGYEVVHELGKDQALVVKLPASVRVEEALVALRNAGGVKYAEPDWVVHVNQTPNDPSFSQLWGLNNTGQTGGTPGADIHAPGAWDVSTGSASITVAVIDTGIDYTHPDLAPNMWTNPTENTDGYTGDLYGYDFADDKGDPKDDFFHGTHCAGTIGARGNNGTGVTGVCWNVKLMALKFLDSTGSGYDSNAVRTIDFARTHGAKVMSNSWGGGGYSQALYDAISAANDAGILFVVAAGNDTANTDVSPDYPSCFTLPNIISVAATDNTDTLASFSNYGANSVDLGAPGVDIYSTLPTYLTSAMTSYSLSTNYGTLSGTSMATPHVAGTAALLLASEPTLTPLQIKQRLLASVDAVPTLAGVTVSGGRLDASRALHKQTVPLLQAVISTPINNAPVSKTVNIFGVADSSDFTSYSVDVGAGANPTTYTTTGVTLATPGGKQHVDDGKLATWQASGPGTFTIRLTVHAASGSRTASTTVNVDQYLKPGFPTFTIPSGGSWLGGANVCVVAADLLGDGNQEIVATGLGSGPLYAFSNQGQLLPGWPVYGAGAGYPAAADLNGSGHATVAATYFGANAAWGLYDAKGQFLPGWPLTLANGCGGPPLLTDVNGDGVKDVILNQQNKDVSIFSSNGAPLSGWPQYVNYYSQLPTIAAADVDGDGYTEIFTIDGPLQSGVIVNGWHHDGSMLPGWPQTIPAANPSSVWMAIGDVDGDGKLDIVVATGNQVFALNADGSMKPGWPFTMPFTTAWGSTPPALADLDGDNVPEIVIACQGGSNTYVYALNGVGAVLPGWPVITTDQYYWINQFAPVVGDIDGDGKPDILMGFSNLSSGSDAELIAWHADGTVLKGFPKYLSLGWGAVPAIADLDHDGRNDVVALSSAFNGTSAVQPFVYAWDFNAPSKTSGRIEWGQYRGNSAHTGLYQPKGLPLRPFAVSQTIKLTNNQPVAVSLSGTDSHNAKLTYTVISQPKSGTLTGLAPNLTYTPASGFHGLDTLTFKVNNGTWDSYPATVSFISDAPPVAHNSSVSTTEDSVNVPIPLQASDPDNDLLTYTLLSGPTNGSISGSGATLLYTPNYLYYGPDSLTFKVSDGIYTSAVATVSITVAHVNHPPVAQDGSIITAVNTPANVALTAYDVDNDPLTYAVVAKPAHGTLTGTLPNLQYTPVSGYMGADSFTFTANDGHAQSNVATVSLYVDGPPEAQAVTVNLVENTSAAFNLVATDVNSDVLSYNVVTFPQHGELLMGMGADCTYIPDWGYAGPDTITYQAYDGYLYSNVATVSINVAVLVVANNDSVTTTPGTPVTVYPLANDFDQNGLALHITSFTQPVGGTLTAGANSTFIYTPLAGFTGSDVFSYTIADTTGSAATGNVVVTVTTDAAAVGTWPTMGNDISRSAGLPVAVSSDPLVADWSATLSDQRLRQVAVGQGLVFAVYNVYFGAGTVVALDANTGAVKWSANLGDTSYIGGASYAAGHVFVQQDTTSASGNLYSLDAATGAIQWTSPWSVQWEEYYAPLVANNTVYIGGGEFGGLYAFNQTTGAQNFFNAALNQVDLWTPAMYQNRLFTWLNGNFREHDPSTGAVLWTLSFPGLYPSASGTIPAIANGIAYVADGASSFQKLHAINLTTHTEAWSAPGPYALSPAIENGVVYAIRGTAVDALSASTGQVLRTYQTNDSLQWQPIVTENTLFIASGTTTYVFNLSDGALRQTLPTGGVLSLAGNRLYTASGAGLLATYVFRNPRPLLQSIWADVNPVQLPAATGVHVAASDPQNNPLTYTWSLVSGPGRVTFTPNGSASASDSVASFSAPGVYTLSVTAVNGSNAASESLTVTVLPANQPPVITGIAAPATVYSSSAVLKVTATDDGGEAALKYAWASSPATVKFSASGTNAAKNVTATFPALGTYVLTVTVADTQGLSAKRSVTITVRQGVTRITVAPASVTIPINGKQTFTATAFDQFNHVLAGVLPTWRATGGTITSGGAYTAGATAGTFNVSASSGSVSGSAAVTVAKGVLAVSAVVPPATVNLSTDGPRDWAHWGLSTNSNFDHKAGVVSQISNMTLVGALTSARTTASPALSWTGGTPTVSNSGTKNCLSVSGVGKGFQFTVPAGKTAQHLHLYIAVRQATGKLQASLSDGSVATLVDTSVANTSGTTNKEYTLQFAGVAPGAKLTVTWTLLSGTGSVMLEAATLAP